MISKRSCLHRFSSDFAALSVEIMRGLSDFSTAFSELQSFASEAEEQGAAATPCATQLVPSETICYTKLLCKEPSSYAAVFFNADRPDRRRLIADDRSPKTDDNHGQF